MKMLIYLRNYDLSLMVKLNFYVKIFQPTLPPLYCDSSAIKIQHSFLLLVFAPRPLFFPILLYIRKPMDYINTFNIENIIFDTHIIYKH